MTLESPPARAYLAVHPLRWGMTSTRASRQIIFWVTAFGLLVLSLWLLGSVLLPFVLGMAFGYLLDPVVDRMARHGVSRGIAAGTLVLGAYGIGVVLVLLVAPIAMEQGAALAAKVPAYVAWVYDAVGGLARRAADTAGMADESVMSQPLVGLVERMAELTGTFLSKVLGHGLAVINLALLLAITPLVAFYLLRDWPLVVAEIDDWLPREHAATIRAQMHQIDVVLSGFVRGTAIVCGALALFYATTLSLVGLDFGLVIGLTAGAVSFIPYIGTLFGLVTSVGVAIYQFWPNWPMVAVVLAIFIAGQLGQDYVLTPRLIGDRVGLHPLWVIFAVLAGGSLFGFTGMLVAVPACAVIGVVTRFAIARYKASPLYRGS